MIINNKKIIWERKLLIYLNSTETRNQAKGHSRRYSTKKGIRRGIYAIGSSQNGPKKIIKHDQYLDE